MLGVPCRIQNGEKWAFSGLMNAGQLSTRSVVQRPEHPISRVLQVSLVSVTSEFVGICLTTFLAPARLKSPKWAYVASQFGALQSISR